MSDKQFVKGLNVKHKDTQYGVILKCGINITEFCDNNKMNDKGWVNFDIKKGKSGNWYAELNTYGQNFEGNNENSDEEIVQFDNEEIPF